MLSTDIYIVTSFTRNQMAMTGACIDYQDPRYTTYQIFVFQSRIQHFLEHYFKSTDRMKYKYDHFVLLDVPDQGMMVTTVQVRDVNDQPIELEREIIRDINLEITNINTLHPNYCLFYVDHSTKISRPWVRSLLPSLIFERAVYEFFKEPEMKIIPSVVQNGCIYLDLSEDINYDQVVQKLSADINHTLEDFYKRGTLPEMLSPLTCVENERFNLCRIVDDKALYTRVPGQFVHYDGRSGEEVLDEIAEISVDVSIPLSDSQLVSDFTKSVSIEGSKYATVYVVNFTKVDPNMSLPDDQVGAEFLVSLKNFLNADAIISKEITPGYFEVYVNKNGQYLESAIDIKEMFGYQFFTHDPIGLLVVQDLGILSETKVIYDAYHNIGGVFVPLVYLGDIVELYLLNIQLVNRQRNVEAYTFSPKLENQISKLQLKIISKIDKYIFVEKSTLITKRIVYKSLQNSESEMLIVGDWDFISMNATYIIDITNQILKEHHISKKPNVREGPFSSLIVPVLPERVLERLIQLINVHVKQKYNFGRQF